MVMAHPLDWYYSRWALIGEAEQIRARDKNDTLYHRWWKSQGEQLFMEAIRRASANDTLFPIPQGVIDTAGDSPENLDISLKYVLQEHLNLFGVVFTDTTTSGRVLNDIFASLTNPITKLSPSAAADIEQTRRELDAVRRAYQSYVQMDAPR
jgi:hypothetical protein